MHGIPAEFTSAHEYVTQIIKRKGRQVSLYDYLTTYPHELLRGIFVAGSIGSGKSQRAMRIVQAALDSDFGCLVFDPSTDYQRLCRVRPDAVVIDMMEFYQNPLEPPPDMPMDEWTPIFIQVFAQTFGLKDPSIAIVQKQLKNLIEAYHDGVDEPPILSELHGAVEEYIPRNRSQETSSYASVLNRLELILDSQVERCLNVRHGFQPTDFEEGLLVIQLRPLGIERVHEFMVGIAIAKLYAYRAYQLRTGQPLGKSVFTVIEEAHRFLSEKRQGDRYGQRMYVERALVECRKMGMGFMVVDQLPHQVSSHVTSSCNLWVVCRLVDAAARKEVGDVLCLESVWSRDGLMELPTGAAFVRVERMEELEAVSPLVEPPTSILDANAVYLPAIVAAAVPQSDLFEPLPERVESIMARNQRYLKFFERNVMQDIDRIREKVSHNTRLALDALLKHMLGRGTPTNQGFLAHYGLRDSGTLSQHSNKDEIRLLTRQQIDELSRYLTILASRPCGKVLEVLDRNEALKLSIIATEAGISRSWASRTIGRLQNERLAVRLSGAYTLTEKGRGVLRWARALNEKMHDMTNSNSLSIPMDDARWLLRAVEQARAVHEKSTVAGWQGGDAFRNDMFRLEVLSRYVIEKREPSGLNNDQRRINNDLLTALAKGMKSGILPALLDIDNTISYSELEEELSHSSSTLRRHLSNLMSKGIVKRERKSGNVYVVLDSDIRYQLSRPYNKTTKKIVLDKALVRKMCRAAVDTELMLLLVVKNRQHNALESVLKLCLRTLEE